MAKTKKAANLVLLDKVVMSKIYMIREQKVMLDRDLAELYGVLMKRLNEQVRRNIERFPDDFMFQLSNEDWDSLRSQFATLETGRGKHPKYLPMVFTKQGVSMLSSVLNSSIAIQVNIQIIRIFTKMREMLLTHKDILLQLEKLEREMMESKQDIAIIFKTLKQLVQPAAEKRRMIGFKSNEEK